jgi:hypothetical protein
VTITVDPQTEKNGVNFQDQIKRDVTDNYHDLLTAAYWTN